MILFLLSSAVRSLTRKKSRAALTILGVAIGVASVTLVSSIGQYGSAAVSDELESLGLSGMTISAAESNDALLSEEELAVIQSSAALQAATPVLVTTTEVSSKRYHTNALAWGIDTNADDIISLEICYGRMFDRTDLRNQKNVCLVDETFAQNAYARSNIIGKSITLLCNGVEQQFEVVGIAKTGSGLLQNMMGSYIPTFVYLPYTTFQKCTGRSGFDQIAVKASDSGGLESMEQTILARLEQESDQPEAYTANDIAKQRESLNGMLDMITLILSAVGAVSLLVASLSIMTVMLVSVSERTREIGVKKSLGATRRSILLEFLFEALLLSLTGCLLGLAAGCLLSLGGSVLLNASFQMRGDILALSLLFSVFSGVIFGVYPAYQAAKLRPVDALRRTD